MLLNAVKMPSAAGRTKAIAATAGGRNRGPCRPPPRRSFRGRLRLGTHRVPRRTECNQHLAGRAAGQARISRSFLAAGLQRARSLRQTVMRLTPSRAITGPTPAFCEGADLVGGGGPGGCAEAHRLDRRHGFQGRAQGRPAETAAEARAGILETLPPALQHARAPPAWPRPPAPRSSSRPTTSSSRDPMAQSRIEYRVWRKGQRRAGPVSSAPTTWQPMAWGERPAPLVPPMRQPGFQGPTPGRAALNGQPILSMRPPAPRR